jgi:hypothetical protein
MTHEEISTLPAQAHRNGKVDRLHKGKFIEASLLIVRSSVLGAAAAESICPGLAGLPTHNEDEGVAIRCERTAAG